MDKNIHVEDNQNIFLPNPFKTVPRFGISSLWRNWQEGQKDSKDRRLEGWQMSLRDDYSKLWPGHPGRRWHMGIPKANYMLNCIIRLQAVLELITNEMVRAINLLTWQPYNLTMRNAICHVRTPLDWLPAQEEEYVENSVWLNAA